VYGLVPPGSHHGREYRRWRAWIHETEFLGRQELQEMQVGELRRLLDYCFNHVPFYREFARRSGFKAGDFRRIGDLQHLPLIGKEDLRDRKTEFLSDAWRSSSLHYTTTGGSTGIPFGFYRTGESLAREAATVDHLWEEHGYHRWRDRCAVLRGLFTGGPRGESWQYNPFRKELHLSTYALTPSSASMYLDLIRQHRTSFLQAYPSAATLLAQLAGPRGGVRGTFRAVFTASENLYREQRKYLEREYGCPIVDFYGQSEQAALARQCSHSDYYHFMPQYGIVEFLRPDGSPAERAGELAEVVATGFANWATPVIRYRTRDLAALGKGTCPCGRDYPLAERIEGRLQELVITPDGRKISMTAMNMHDDLFDRVLQFQFVQESPENVTLCLVPAGGFGEADALRIQSEIGEKLGATMSLKLQLVEKIPPGPSGKHRFLVQRIPLNDLDQTWC
jgi:phenylacetate-coenzyme A ligase PaaK-like adenylate-forming protein